MENPTKKPEVADSNKTAYTVVFTPNDSINFSIVECDVTLTVKPAQAVAAAVTANNRTYDGTKKDLMNVDESTLVGGTMQYSLDGKSFSAAISTGTDTKAYTVWYRVKGDANHNDTEAKSVTVTITKPAAPTRPGICKYC